MAARPSAIHSALFVAALATGAACHESDVQPPDLAASLLMKWSHNPGLPVGHSRSGLPLVLADRRLIAFGGSPTTETDTWAFSLKDDAWSTLLMGSASPPGRTGHCAAYVPAQNEVLYVGGHGDADTTALSPLVLTAGTPNFLDVAGNGPTPLDGCAAAYLAKPERIVVFGGRNGAALSAETWLYDAGGQSFSQITPSASPSPRSGAALVVDPGPTGELTSGRLLLFGGATAGAESAETWIFDGDTWSLVNTSDPRPAARSNAAVAVDPNRRLLYVFGGAAQGVLLDDLWRLDLATLTWQRLDLSDGPSGRAEAGVAYDPILDRLLLFGGRDGDGPLSDGWTLSPAT